MADLKDCKCILSSECDYKIIIEKTSLLVAEGHVEYNYQDMLTRIQ